MDLGGFLKAFLGAKIGCFRNVLKRGRVGRGIYRKVFI